MRRNRPIPFKNKIKFAIIVDGDCESWYFQMLRRNERDINVDLKPEIPQNKKLKEQFEKVVELSKHYDKVFWVVDYDVINSESSLAKKGTETASHEFKKYVTQIKKKYPNVVIIINNPCLEFWLLLHFEYTSAPFNDCDNTIKKLKNHLHILLDFHSFC